MVVNIKTESGQVETAQDGNESSGREGQEQEACASATGRSTRYQDEQCYPSSSHHDVDMGRKLRIAFIRPDLGIGSCSSTSMRTP